MLQIIKNLLPAVIWALIGMAFTYYINLDKINYVNAEFKRFDDIVTPYGFEKSIENRGGSGGSEISYSAHNKFLVLTVGNEDRLSYSAYYDINYEELKEGIRFYEKIFNEFYKDNLNIDDYESEIDTILDKVMVLKKVKLDEEEKGCITYNNKEICIGSNYSESDNKIYMRISYYDFHTNIGKNGGNINEKNN